MATPHLGYADEYRALAYGHVLWLIAKGKNTSTGWRNWFEPLREPADFDFMQEPPSGISAPIVLPFSVLNGFPLPASQDVTIREEKGGIIETKKIKIEHGLCPIDEHVFQTHLPPHVAAFIDHVRSGRASPGGTSIRKHLGAFDIPFGCASWTHPLRGKRIDLYLEVDVAGVQDVEGAVVECLKESAIAAALPTLLTPIGWAAGATIFVRLLEACLVQKLHNILKVQVEAESHCD